MSNPEQEGTRTVSVEQSTSTAHRLLHYDGACGNIHGHNFHWDVSFTVDMEDADEDNMPVDMKDVSDEIDVVDHAVMLNEDDPLINAPTGVRDLLGDVVTTDGDPTCEVVVRWMARRLFKIDDSIDFVDVTVNETDKYGIEATWSEHDELSVQAD